MSKTIYLVGRRPEQGEWELQGLYESKADAESACIDRNWFVMPCEINTPYQIETIASGYYPVVNAEIERRVNAIAGGETTMLKAGDYGDYIGTRNPSTPKWQEQLEALNDCESHNDIYSIYPDRADGVYYWTCDGDIGSDSDYKRFNGSTPEAAIDAAYQSVIGSGVQS